MANISDADGVITFVAKTLEQVKFIEKVCRRACGQFWYSTDIAEDNCYYQEGGMWCADDAFTGNGRWSYQSNIEHFLVWLSGDRSDISDEDLRALKDINFKIRFSYRDLDFNAPFCGHGVGEVMHTAGHALDEKGVVGFDSMPWSRESLVALDVDPFDIDFYMQGAEEEEAS